LTPIPLREVIDKVICDKNIKGEEKKGLKCLKNSDNDTGRKEKGPVER
jgi:hypothetical protein